MSEYYRLLNEGEPILATDEFLHSGSGNDWRPAVEVERYDRRMMVLHRRKITLPEWRPIGELPEVPCTVLIYDARIRGSIVATFYSIPSLYSDYTHWMPLPEPPKPEKSAEELAFEKAANGATFRQGEKDILRLIWLAALEFAKGK